MIHSNIKSGIRHTQQLEVTKENTASAYGSGDVDVFATPAMIALMEMTARNSIQDLLPDGYTTVGTEVNIKHLKASAIGNRVRCESEVLDVNGNKINFKVQVWDDTILVGDGTHTRAIVKLEKFISKH